MIEHISKIIDRELAKLQRQTQAAATTQTLLGILREQQKLESKQIDIEEHISKKK